MDGIRKYSEEESEFLRTFTFGHSYKEITDEFNNRFQSAVKQRQIAAYLKNHKILTGRTGRFEKGHEPANKGMKGVYQPGSEKGWFQKGNVPKNHKPVGTESIRHSYKKNKDYIYVKVAEPNKWRMKHILEWEKHHGPVKKGNIVIFLDGNTLNTDISNLQEITQSMNARLNRNHLRFNDADRTRTGINIVNVILKIKERERERN